jgi:predicted AlkP superfamily pyrophosphatase or phosphodiesterase
MKKNLFTLLLLLCASLTSFAQLNHPKMVVGIIVDQMRPDYLTRFYKYYDAGGFKTLMSDGYSMWNVHYNYIPTYTGPGHASIYSGTTPRFHGIIGNDIYYREKHKLQYCVLDTSVVILGNDRKNASYSKKDSMEGMSPQRLLVSNICDELKVFTSNKSKIISISVKDRAAILSAGHLADYVLWFDQKTGNFVTSSYYPKGMPGWAEDFNRKKYADSIIKENSDQWIPLFKSNNYYSDCDTAVFVRTPDTAFTLPGFPHKINKKNNKYSNFYHSPFSNTLLTDLAIEAIKKGDLGKGPVPDFLQISYSSTDAVGHWYGPFSKEIKDTYLRLDKDLERLIQTLDQTIGKDNYVLFLTADHGIPEIPKESGKVPGGYINPKGLYTSANTFLNRKFHLTSVRFIETLINDQFYLDSASISKNKLDMKVVQTELADFLIHQHGIALAYTASELNRGEHLSDIGSLVQNGFQPKLSGDVAMVLESGFMEPDYQDKNVVVEHGSGYSYDTNVPLIWYGQNIKKGETWQLHYITDIAPTLSMLLRIKYPSACFGNPIMEIQK